MKDIDSPFSPKKLGLLENGTNISYEVVGPGMLNPIKGFGVIRGHDLYESISLPKEDLTYIVEETSGKLPFDLYPYKFFMCRRRFIKVIGE